MIEELVGTTIASQFKISRKLGAGGMGAVFLAEQIGMDRPVVVKVMHPELTAGSAKAVERFKREAKAVAQLNHPNIVQIYVFGETASGQMYIAMEYIKGQDLTAAMKKGPLSQVRSLMIVDQVCSALIEAHGAQIVHRDLKPDNIMLTDRHGNPDYVKVLDFGIAKMADPGQATLTQAGAVFGTPRYMAPEQAKGEGIDARADVYALGVILYEMLTGYHPFEGATTAVEYIVKHATEDVVMPSTAFEGLNLQPRVEQILATCLKKAPDERFRSARELQRDVRLALRDFPEAQRGFPTGETGPSPVRPARASTGAGSRAGTPKWVWLTVGLVVAAGIVLGVLLATQGTTNQNAVVAGATVTPPTPTTPVAETKPFVPDAKPMVPKPATRPAAATALAEGMPIDGFPVPARARTTASTAHSEMLETDLDPEEILNFYQVKLGKTYKLSPIPNGLSISDRSSPFSSITLSAAGGDRTHIIFVRNALAKRKVVKERGDFFDVKVIPGATVLFKNPQAVALRSRKPFAEICAFYNQQLGDINGVTVVKDVSAKTPYCNFVQQGADVAWQGLSMTPDPTSPGATMISIMAKTQ